MNYQTCPCCGEHHETSACRTAALVGSSDGFGSVFAPLDAALSANARHAFQAYQIAFTQGDPTITVRELRNAIRRIYGEAVDRELEQHLNDRCEAVLPNDRGVPCDGQRPSVGDPRDNH